MIFLLVLVKDLRKLEEDKNLTFVSFHIKLILDHKGMKNLVYLR